MGAELIHQRGRARSVQIRRLQVTRANMRAVRSHICSRKHKWRPPESSLKVIFQRSSLPFPQEFWSLCQQLFRTIGSTGILATLWFPTQWRERPVASGCTPHLAHLCGLHPVRKWLLWLMCPSQIYCLVLQTGYLPEMYIEGDNHTTILWTCASLWWGYVKS